MTEKLYCLLEGLVGVVAAGLWSGVGGVGVARSGCYHSCVQAQDKDCMKCLREHREANGPMSETFSESLSCLALVLISCELGEGRGQLKQVRI